MKQVYRVERATSDANGFYVQFIPAVQSQQNNTPGVAQSFVPSANSPQAITVPVSAEEFGQFTYGKYFELELRAVDAPVSPSVPQEPVRNQNVA